MRGLSLAHAFGSEEYIGCGQFVYYSWVPGISPKFLKPPGYDCLVFLRHQIIPICCMLTINRRGALRTTRFPNCFALTAIRESGGASF
jgi:hypothetical protein